MAKVEIYTTMMCPYCYHAKQLLEHKGVSYEETDVGMNGKLRQEMTDRAGGAYTVPQIFIDGQHVGGCDDLYALDQAGKLDAQLGLG